MRHTTTGVLALHFTSLAQLLTHRKRKGPEDVEGRVHFFKQNKSTFIASQPK